MTALGGAAPSTVAAPVGSVLASARTLGDVLQGLADERPNKIAFETPDGRCVSFGAFNDRVNQLAQAIDTLGVQPGARVAILARNRPEYVEVYGLARTGLVIVPLNWRLTAADLSRLLDHSAPEVLVVDAHYQPLIDSLRKTLSSVRHFILLGAAVPAVSAGASGWLDYEQLIAGALPAPSPHQARPSDTLCLIYTSGTTGAPKGVAITHAAALGNARVGGSEALTLTDQDLTLAVMPLFHAGGMWYHLFPSYATGCTTLILPEFDAAGVLHWLVRRRITNVHLVPTMISALLAQPGLAGADLSHLRVLFYAASSMPAELLRCAMQAFPCCGFAQSYGSTEGGALTVLDAQAHRRACVEGAHHLLASCGRPMAGRQLRIVDDTHQVLAPGLVGEIEVCSPDLMGGYWLNEEATRAAMEGGWFKTGDLGYFDAEGYLYIVDRKNDLIVTGGENVFPTEVETQLYRDPDVQEAAVFGLPDAQWVERVVAAVVLKPGAQTSAEELIRRLRERLAAYKCPKAVYFTAALPKNAAGKVLRKSLRSQYGGPN